MFPYSTPLHALCALLACSSSRQPSEVASYLFDVIKLSLNG